MASHTTNCQPGDRFVELDFDGGSASNGIKPKAKLSNSRQIVNFESSEHATLVHAEPRTRGTRYSGTGWVCIYHWKSERTFCWHPNFSMNFIQMLTFNEFNSKANSINSNGIREWISNSMIQNKENAENANFEWISNSRSKKFALSTLTDDYLLAFGRICFAFY